MEAFGDSLFLIVSCFCTALEAKELEMFLFLFNQASKHCKREKFEHIYSWVLLFLYLASKVSQLLLSESFHQLWFHRLRYHPLLRRFVWVNAPRMSGSTRMTLHFSKKSISIKPWFAPGVWGVDGFETPAETWRSFLTTQIFPPDLTFFSSPNDFHPCFLVFWTCWKILSLKVGFYRGVGLRLLCRSQSLLRPLTSERSTEGPVKHKTACVSVWPPMGCAPEKNGKGGVFVKQWRASNQHYLIHFNSGLCFGMAQTTNLLVVGLHLPPGPPGESKTFTFSAAMCAAATLQPAACWWRVVGRSRVAGNVSAALGWRQVEGPESPSLWTFSPQKCCNKRS